MLPAPKAPQQTSFDIWVSNLLPEQSPPQEVVPYILFSTSIIYAICALIHIPNTRPWRIVLWPFGTPLLIFSLLRLDMIDQNPTFGGLFFPICALASAGTRWAFAEAPPVIKPLTHQPLLGSLRQFLPFKALDLILNESRHVGHFDGTPYAPPTNHYTIQHIAYHVIKFILAWLLSDIVTYPLRIDLQGIGNPHGIAVDWKDRVMVLSREYGIPGFMVQLGYSTVILLSILRAQYLSQHLIPVIGLSTGLYSPEEFPLCLNQPYRAESLNEVWGTRYHQWLRFPLETLSTPFAFLPRSLGFFPIFLISGFLHFILSRIFHTPVGIHNTILKWGLAALGCWLERTYFFLTGRKVSGWKGRIWTFSFLLLAAYFESRWYVETGTSGAFRRPFYDGGNSIIEWAVYGLGYGEKPIPH